VPCIGVLPEFNFDNGGKKDNTDVEVDDEDDDEVGEVEYNLLPI
jgi:hypothetical protein